MRRCRALQSHCRGVAARGRIARPYRHGCGALCLQRSRLRRAPAAAAPTRSLPLSVRYEVGSARPAATTQCGGGEHVSPTVAASRRMAASLGRMAWPYRHGCGALCLQRSRSHRASSAAARTRSCRAPPQVEAGSPRSAVAARAAVSSASVPLSRRRIAWPYRSAVSARVRRTVFAAFTFAPRSSSSCAHSISPSVTAI